MNKIAAFWALFQTGKEVANPKLFKMGQAGGNAVGLFILAAIGVANALGYELSMDEQVAMVIGGGVVALGNFILTVITTKKIGVGGTDASAPVAVEPVAAKAGNQLPPAVPVAVPKPTLPANPKAYRVGEAHPSTRNAVIANVDLDKPVQPASKPAVTRPVDPTTNLYFGD